MLIIRCTKKLLVEMKQKLGENPKTEPVFTWHASLLNLHRRKAVLLINNQSLYPILLLGLKVQDFEQFGKIIEDAIKTVFLAEGIPPETIGKYFKEAGHITFTKTSDRSVISAMNQVAEFAAYYEPDEWDTDNLTQTDFSLKMGVSVVKTDDGLRKPKEILLDTMAQFTQGNSNEPAKR